MTRMLRKGPRKILPSEELHLAHGTNRDTKVDHALDLPIAAHVDRIIGNDGLAPAVTEEDIGAAVLGVRSDTEIEAMVVPPAHPDTESDTENLIF